MNLAKIRRIAKAVRSAAEQLVNEGDMGPCYGSNLMGGCGAVSAAFATLLGRNDSFRGGFFEDSGHCWVELDGYIWDLTATQFGIVSKIHMTPRTSRKYTVDLEGDEALEHLKTWNDAGWQQRLLVRATRLLGGS